VIELVETNEDQGPVTIDEKFFDLKTGNEINIGNHVLISHNVNIIDTSNKISIQGDLAEHFENKNISIITGHALYTQRLDKDSLYLHADTLYSFQAIGKNKKDSSIVRAYHNSKIYKKDLQGICDSISYTAYDSTLIMYKSPLLWSDSMQLSAKEIVLHLRGKKIDGFNLLSTAFIITQVDSVKFNQLKGKEIIGYFLKDTIHQIKILGNAQAIYFIENEKKQLIGMNKTECRDMNIHFKKGSLNQITFIDKPTSTIFPLKDITEENQRIKGFNWQLFKRPTFKELLK
jgi:lipopolysaccharide export system protein LptA